MSTPNAAPVAWKATHKATGRSITVMERMWVDARLAGALLLGCDRFDVMCVRVEDAK
jgi:hypothetical protein